MTEQLELNAVEIETASDSGDSIPSLQSVSDSDSEWGDLPDSQFEVLSSSLDSWEVLDNSLAKPIDDILEVLSVNQRNRIYDWMMMRLTRQDPWSWIGRPVSEDQVAKDLEEYYRYFWPRLGLLCPSRYSSSPVRHSHLGDVYAKCAEEVLRKNGPYCYGPLGADFGSIVEGEFCVYQISETQHIIMNEHLLEDVVMDSALLRDPDFDLPYWYRNLLMQGKPCHCRCQCCHDRTCESMGDAASIVVEQVLQDGLHHLGDGAPWGATNGHRFLYLGPDPECIRIHDTYLTLTFDILRYYLENPHFDLWNAYALRAYRALILAECTPFSLDDLEGELFSFFSADNGQASVSASLHAIEANAVNVPNRSWPESLPALQRNAATPRNFRRVIPEPIVIVVNINGHPACALLDSGSLSDFMSSKLTHQLGVKTFELEKPLPMHLAVQGSHAKINVGCKAHLAYQSVDEQ
ncbi:unnamed protein product [Somion occarium]|uniref:Uncharacterized protein n=1 Tax=Somion occarium TaxID=3059160 RepID=A0ABP1DET8_9APHY